jgi:hypothetical protein
MHNRFNKNNSNTFTQLTDPYKPKEIKFGPWGNMYVSLGNDFFEIPQPGEANNKNIEPSGEGLREKFSIYLSHYYEGQQFQNLSWDGGIGVPSVNAPVREPEGEEVPTNLMQMMMEKNIIKLPVISFWTDYEKGIGECIYGGINPDKIQGEINWILLTDELHYPDYKKFPAFWVIRTQNLNVGDETLFDNLNFCLDTGSSVFKGGPRIINRIVSEVTRGGRLDNTIKKEHPDFSEYPDLTIKIKGINYIIKPERYFMQIARDTWILAFHIMEGLGDLLVVGSVFLQEFYLVYVYIDDQERYIGLADLKR